DFVTIFPRYLSLYIFSFLDPKSLCRCSQVSWNWKTLSENERIWQMKCLQHAWYLPTLNTPQQQQSHTLSTTCAHKLHYIACARTLDF
ncbi:hypothetical protein HELRODRAFT_138327, partial [Helobdella robusta]|uniref:F-box domain-containing protein n=1 Tax=Helobdella robusta TaxID=6412 RepID=T1EIT7_HELRO